MAGILAASAALAACRTEGPGLETGMEAVQELDLPGCILDPGCDYLFGVGHRGAGIEGPDNTLLGISMAESFGMDVVEVDIRPTADGVLVLMHDSDIGRTTNGSGLVSDLLLEELQAFVVLGGEEFPDEPVPTFIDALEALPADMMVNVDAKTDRWDLIHADLVASGKVGSAWVQTSSLAETQLVSESYPDLMQMVDAETVQELEALLPYSPPLVEIPWNVWDTGLFEACSDAGVKAAQNALGMTDSAILAEIEGGGDGSEALRRHLERGSVVVQTDIPSRLGPLLAAENRSRGW